MKRIYLILILVLLLVGCGHKEEVKETNKTGDIRTEEKAESPDTVEEESEKNETEPVVEEKTTNNTEETIQNPSTGTTTEKNESTTTTQTPATNNNTTSNNTSNNSNNTTPNTNDNTSNNNSTTPKPSTPVHEHKWTEVVEEEIHYYDWRTICGKCGEDLTDLGDDGITYHSAVICHNGYTVKFIEVDYITENVQKETIVTGYKCSCGEVKEK